MTNSSKRPGGILGLLWLLFCLSPPVLARDEPRLSTPPYQGAAARPPALSRQYAGASSARMQVGLTLVSPGEETALPDPSSLDFPASANAIRCESESRGYRECRTPFHGPVTLAREVSATRCVEDENWGWHQGRVWVDRGCAAVFMRIDKT